MVCKVWGARKVPGENISPQGGREGKTMCWPKRNKRSHTNDDDNNHNHGSVKKVYNGPRCYGCRGDHFRLVFVWVFIQLFWCGHYDSIHQTCVNGFQSVNKYFLSQLCLLIFLINPSQCDYIIVNLPRSWHVEGFKIFLEMSIPHFSAATGRQACDKKWWIVKQILEACLDPGSAWYKSFA